MHMILNNYASSWIGGSKTLQYVAIILRSKDEVLL